MPDPSDFLRLALEPTRLAVLGHAATGPVDAAALAEALDVQKKKVQRAVVTLQQAGLLDDSGTLDVAELRRLGASLPRFDVADDSIVEGPWTRDEADVLRRSFEGTRLKQLPAQRSKRLVVLERIAQEFEPGLRYSERDVNLAIQVVHPDYAAIRRYLVDEGLLTRADGVYWRSGGRTG